jgi:hypothetical protein
MELPERLELWPHGSIGLGLRYNSVMHYGIILQ